MINMTNKNNCKHCSDKVNNRKTETFEIDCTDKINDYWKHYFIADIVAVVNSAALIMIWLWSHDDCTY